MRHKLNYYKIFGYGLIPLDIILSILLELDFFGKLPTYWNSIYVFYIFLVLNTLFLTLRLKNMPYNEREDDYTVFVSKYIFLLSLAILVVNQFLHREIIIQYTNYILSFTIALGFLTFFASKDRIETEIEHEKNNRNKNDEIKEEDFDWKFPKIAKLNVPYGFEYALREKDLLMFLSSLVLCPFILLIRLFYKLIKWMYREGFLYAFLLFLSMIFFMGVYLYRLGDQYLWTDEVFSFEAGKIILEKGFPLFNSGLDYGRSKIYHYLLASTMQIFGINEFGSRVINLLVILVLGFCIYNFLKKDNRIIAIFGAIIFFSINYSLATVRETRMYLLFALFFLSSLYFFYKLDSRQNKKFTLNVPLNLVLFLSLFYMTLETNVMGILIIGGIIFYYLLKNIKISLNKNEILFILLGGVLLIIGAIFFYNTFNILSIYQDKMIATWAKGIPLKPEFYFNLIKYNFVFFNITFILSIILMLVFKDKKLLLIGSVFFFSLLFISFQKNLQERYMYFLFPLLAILLSSSIHYLKRLLNKDRGLTLLFFILALFLIINHFILFYHEINSIDSFDKNTIYQYKKFDFNKVSGYLDKENSIIISDVHSTYTLRERGYNVTYLLLDKKNINDIYGEKEPYFEIPIITYESEEFFKLLNQNNTFFVIRDDQYFDNLDDYFYNSNISIKPIVFISKRI